MKLFEDEVVPGPDAVDFWRTPSWLGAGLVEEADPVAGDVIVEPTCGDGAILAQIPREFRAYGVEIDAQLAAAAACTTGREVIVGDILKVALPEPPTLVIGNPPFSQTFVEALLARMQRELVEGGRMVLLLSVHLLQTSTTVVRYADLFSLDVKLVPRDVFPGLQRPLVVATMTKNADRKIVGIAFAREIADLRQFPAPYRFVLERSTTNVWVAACEKALRFLGRPATVDEIAREIVGDRPTSTPNWRPAIRKALQQSFPRTAPATYTMPAAA